MKIITVNLVKDMVTVSVDIPRYLLVYKNEEMERDLFVNHSHRVGCMLSHVLCFTPIHSAAE